MHADFEYAYYLYLSDLDFRSEMVNCAVNALLSNKHGDYLAMLAGAHPEDPDLLTLFRRASAEIGVSLPSEREEDEWRVLKSVQFASEGRRIKEQGVDQLFQRNLLFIFYKLRALENSLPLRDFADHYVAYVGEGAFNSYTEWEAKLCDLCAELQASHAPSSITAFVDSLTNLIVSRAYGGIGKWELEVSYSLVQALVRLSDLNDA